MSLIENDNNIKQQNQEYIKEIFICPKCNLKFQVLANKVTRILRPIENNCCCPTFSNEIIEYIVCPTTKCNQIIVLDIFISKEKKELNCIIL